MYFLLKMGIPSSQRVVSLPEGDGTLPMVSKRGPHYFFLKVSSEATFSHDPVAVVPWVKCTWAFIAIKEFSANVDENG